MSRIKVGVVGTGYLGQHHARVFSELPEAELVGVADIDITRSREVAEKTRTRAYASAEELVGKVEAVSIAAPTTEHRRLAGLFLNAGADVLVEKPMTATLQEADELIAMADAGRRILQVGHLERFNGAVIRMLEMVTTPMFIECHRLSPFPDRGTDVDVVLDLMIHDIDIILSVVRSEVTSIAAVGVPVISRNVDIANARMKFATGCVANVTSSRISMKKERKIRLFQPDAYISLDYQNQELHAYRLEADRDRPEARPSITGGKVGVDKQEPLKAEMKAFLTAVKNRTKPLVSGLEGREALAVAFDVLREIEGQGVIPPRNGRPER